MAVGGSPPREDNAMRLLSSACKQEFLKISKCINQFLIFNLKQMYQKTKVVKYEDCT